MSKEKKKHGYVEVLKYMHLIKSGRSFGSIHKEYGINASQLKVLWARYLLECGCHNVTVLQPYGGKVPMPGL